MTSRTLTAPMHPAVVGALCATWVSVVLITGWIAFQVITRYL
jgi:hypothetical protein